MPESMTPVAAGSLPIEIRFDALSRFDRLAEYCEVAVPFCKGFIHRPDGIALRDGERILATQSRVTGRWLDGSIQWLLLRFCADLPGNQPARLMLVHTTEHPEPLPAPVRAAPGEDGALVVQTGALSMTLGLPGEVPSCAASARKNKKIHHAGLMNPTRGQRTEVGGRHLLTSDFRLPASGLRAKPALIRTARVGDWDAGEVFSSGPEILVAGRRFEARTGPGGWTVVEPGPVCVIVETRGVHQADNGETCLDFNLRLRFFSGKPWFHAEYRVLNREKTAALDMEAVHWRLPMPAAAGSPARRAIGQSNYQTRIDIATADEPLSVLIDGAKLVYQPNEQIPETHYGTFWADWTGPTGGVCVTHHQAFQNYPKALTVEPDSMRVDLVPPDTGGLQLARGMAKLHRLQFHLHAPELPIEDVDVRSLQYQMPDQPVVAPEAVRDAGVFPGIWVDRPVLRVEQFLVDLADRRTRAYGILHWGDGPDMGYTNQGRGLGGLVWTNNEYDFAHAAMQLYARTGERRFLDYLRVTAEHQATVDVCHDSEDPLRHGGQIMHSAGHVTKACSPCHEWVEGLLDYAHQTGDDFFFQTAIGIGENVLRHLEQPHLREPAGTATRVTGWALRTMVALYLETGEQRWKAEADRIAGQFDEWYQRFGGWVQPYTSHTLVRVPFMMAIAASSLMRYWRATEHARTRELIVAGVRDIVDHALLPDGRFYYKSLPSLQKRGAGMYVLEALAYAWELSGDTAFLDAGREAFRELLDGRKSGGSGAWSGPKFETPERAVIWPAGEGPKAFPSAFMPVMAFYRAIVEANREM